VVDNGRSSILGTEFQSVLQCIRCAACINVCPIYRHIGGHSYGSIYPGPIGAVLSPLLGGYDDHKELPFASSLCAACTDACPVKIPLHSLLIEHRRKIVEDEKLSTWGEKLAMKGFGMAMSNSNLLRTGTKLAPKLMKPLVKDGKIVRGPGPMKPWTDIRDFPTPANESFRSWFKKEKGGAAHDN
jgi:L-lactate dehydrogenase complex protein LldF